MQPSLVEAVGKSGSAFSRAAGATLDLHEITANTDGEAV